MDVAGASFSNYLVDTATALKSNQTQMQIAAAVLKQTLDQQDRQAQALLQMIRQSSSLDGAGQIVDVSA
jgi:hypothetical protein